MDKQFEELADRFEDAITTATSGVATRVVDTCGCCVAEAAVAGGCYALWKIFESARHNGVDEAKLKKLAGELHGLLVHATNKAVN